ncbi:hypothetical protein K4K61_011580 [Colletotrichum sp. SAR11_59]|nr:hypothetical protein K4K61_011580 [Colletotrichum sp. SAR11_59]
MAEKKDSPAEQPDISTIHPSSSNVQGQSEVTKAPQDGILDEAAEFLANANDYPPMTPEMGKRIVKKIDAWMIPLLLFTATLGAVDKVQMGTASLYGFQTDNVIFAYFSSVFNGFFAWLVGKIPDSAPLLKWQYLYLLTGTINVLYSIFIWFTLPDSPMNAHFLTDEQKYYATKRLAANRTGIANKVWKWDQVWEALLDIKIWIIFVFNIFINIPNGGLVNFGSIIINNLGFTSLEASLLTMPFGVLATSSAWAFSYLAARWHNRRTLVACIALLLPILGTALVHGLPRTNIAAQMVGLYFMYFYWPPYVVGISLPQANTAGQTKKAVCFSLVQVGYAAGNLIGPQTFISTQAPKYNGAVIAMLTSYVVSIVLMLAYWLVALLENKRRDKKYGKPEAVHEGTVDGFVDITDKKQKDFRYTT